MSYKENDACLQKALPNEMLFVLMARDPTAPIAVLEWVILNLDKQPKDKIIEAIKCASEMIKTQGDIKQKSHQPINYTHTHISSMLMQLKLAEHFEVSVNMDDETLEGTIIDVINTLDKTGLGFVVTTIVPKRYYSIKRFR